MTTPPQDPALVERVLEPHARDLGGFSVRRLLPSAGRRMVGPFIFFDYFGPTTLPPGEGFDVRPHPHINLATVTYLFEGEIVHRDSLGSEQTIRPGEINWMTAGRGIAHSERTAPALRRSGSRLHGIQLWVALPTAHEETAPDFHHHALGELPQLERPGVRLRVLLGAAYGLVSPVHTWSPLFYVDATLDAGAELELPDEQALRAAYVVDGSIACDGRRFAAGQLLVFAANQSGRVQAQQPARLMLLGGAPLDGERHIWWNFVSSSRERIEQAKRDWQQDRFVRVPGDDERIPLPET